MKKYLWISPILFLALGALPAHADVFTYDINFTCNSSTPSCLLPTSGTFTYNSTTDTFTNFEVEWDGIGINLASAANAGPVTPFVGTNACLDGETGGAASYLLMTGCPFTTYEPWFANSGGAFAFTESAGVNNYAAFYGAIPGLPGGAPQAHGDFTLTAVPEPAALTLLFTSLLALAFVSRMRNARR